jgi:hypothetical protein
MRKKENKNRPGIDLRRVKQNLMPLQNLKSLPLRAFLLLKSDDVLNEKFCYTCLGFF